MAGIVGKVRLKLSEWFSDPLGRFKTGDAKEDGLKKPYEALETSKFKPNNRAGRGRGDKRENPRKIEEFYPRGTAGRHESRGPSGPRKTAMPHKGNWQKYPK